MPDISRIQPELMDSAEKSMSRVSTILDAIRPLHETRDRVDAMRKARHGLDGKAESKESPRSGEDWDEVLIPSHDDLNRIRMRIYRPADLKGELPCLYHIHGGGMMLGTIDEEDEDMKLLSSQLEAVVTNVEYRLAPENPYPAGAEDCYDGLAWIHANASLYGVDAKRIAIMGVSAGGGLAASISLMARDRGFPGILFQTLVAPMLDDRNDTPSSREFAGVWPSWPRELNLLGWSALLENHDKSGDIPEYAAPARAGNLLNLPPSYIETSELEVFRDEDVEFALRLMRSGVSTELHVYPGTYHCWHEDAPDAHVTRLALSSRLEWMKQQFNRKPTQ